MAAGVSSVHRADRTECGAKTHVLDVNLAAGLSDPIGTDPTLRESTSSASERRAVAAGGVGVSGDSEDHAVDLEVVEGVFKFGA